ncbi:MFS transporter [Chryseobacterium sp. MYb264]|uniref:MFS transporter n=1 Tax=Chryseobacterium sp. MYb264 TaxID=2745153 RepID=UPI002E0EB16C|nr:MFS transporter [Chryseobacterium sp. MYb264]
MQSLVALKSPNFKLFFIGQSISVLGSWIQKTAVAWVVYQLTGSPFILGLIGFVSLVPTLLLSPYVGSFVEHSYKYKVMKNTQYLAAFQAFLLAFLFYFKMYNISLIVALSLMQGIINAFDVTCRQAMMIELVDNKESLPNAIALNSAMSNLARVVGPALAGILLSLFGDDFCFISNFLSFIPVICCLYMMNLPFYEKKAHLSNAWQELKEGFMYVKSEKTIFSQLLLLSFFSLMLIPFTTLLPVIAKEVFSGTSKTFTVFESAVGVGSLVSAVYMTRLKQMGKLYRIIVISSMIMSAGLFTVSLSRNINFAVLGLALSGLGMISQSAAINTYVQLNAQPGMRARVISYYIMAFIGMTPIGSLLIGFLAEYISTRNVLLIEGGMGILATIVFIMYTKRSRKPSIL